MQVILAYKNNSANRAISHIGLGVTALNAAKSIRAEGIDAAVWPITNAADLSNQLKVALQTESPATHVVVSAPWLSTPDLAQLCADHPGTQFAVNCHSNLGFLQADPSAMRLVREGIDLERFTWNFHVAANSHRLTRWVEAAYSAPCQHLPNMYFLDGIETNARTLRGRHAAHRRIRRHPRAQESYDRAGVGAAVEIANSLRADLEFWVSAGRNEGGGLRQIDAVRQMMNGLLHVKLCRKRLANAGRSSAKPSATCICFSNPATRKVFQRRHSRWRGRRRPQCRLRSHPLGPR